MTTTKRKRPWLKFYPTDWRADPKLRVCSLAARGLWIELLGIMAEAEPYGHLLIEGRKPTDQEIAALVGTHVNTARAALSELVNQGVCSATNEGVLFSRRMVADHEKSQENQRNGKRGGNPALKGAVKPPPAPISQKPEARGQTQHSSSPESSDSETGKSDGQADGPSPAVEIIAAFDAELAAVFGEDRRRPWPASSDRVHAERLAEAGWTPATARGVFRAKLEGRKAGGKGPPNALAWFERVFAEITPADGARMAGSRAAVNGEYRVDPIDDEQKLLVDEWFKIEKSKRPPPPTRADAIASLNAKAAAKAPPAARAG